MKPSIPKGTRDFLPGQVMKRKYIFNVIENVFQKYAYVPIETPTFENLDTLTGKYGEEGDRLLFKILNNGAYLNKSNTQAFENRDHSVFTRSISKRGLRYDLTVPFARYVVMHQNELSLPFKRYQIQPVWRADRPQKGRYQEFYQCDVDVVGSDSLMYEAELVQIYDEVFATLGLKVEIKLNNRKILAGIAEVVGLQDDFMAMCIVLDKLDKIGEESVKTQLIGLGLDDERAKLVLKLIKSDQLSDFENYFKNSDIGRKGIEELKSFHSYFDLKTPVNEVKFDPSLARGLNYYTGCIFEVKSLETSMGSIGGGGRYDDLTAVFGLKNVSGVGISFGAERIFDIMLTLNRFPEHLDGGMELLLMSFDQHGHLKAFEYCTELRARGIYCDVYPDFGKMKKQMKYADAINAKFAGIIGEEEIEKNMITLKDMKSGAQEMVNLHSLIEKLLG